MSSGGINPVPSSFVFFGRTNAPNKYDAVVPGFADKHYAAFLMSCGMVSSLSIASVSKTNSLLNSLEPRSFSFQSIGRRIDLLA
ncbi:MAG: hypothetical protein NC924_09265 [Candidatus Omnitrophica bacterium]|nr:hypothetical protein [Candidatus Omnitrophota bacterium]